MTDGDFFDRGADHATSSTSAAAEFIAGANNASS